MSRAPQGLEVTKALTGDALVDPEVVNGDSVTYTLTVTNHGPDEVDVDIYDEIGEFASVSFTSVETGGVTGNTPGPDVGALDDTAVTMPAASQVVYTLVYVTPDAPFCGTISNLGRVMDPAEKRPVYESAPPIYLGITQDEAVTNTRRDLVHSEFLQAFLGFDLDRFQVLYDLNERNFTLADLIEWVENIAETAGPLDAPVPAPPVVNPNYTP